MSQLDPGPGLPRTCNEFLRQSGWLSTSAILVRQFTEKLWSKSLHAEVAALLVTFAPAATRDSYM